MMTRLASVAGALTAAKFTVRSLVNNFAHTALAPVNDRSRQMATPTPEQLRTLTIQDFMTEYRVSSSIFEDAFRKRKTASEVERDVAKLKSVSSAGKAWIVDERCSWLSIGKHAGVFRFRKV